MIGSKSALAKKALAEAVGKRSYAEALVGLGQTPAIATSLRANVGIFDVIELGRAVSSRGVPGVILGYFRIQAGIASSKDPRGDLGVNLDFGTLRNMLVLLKEEVECCIDRLEVGRGLLRRESSAGHVKDVVVESKSKLNERVPSTLWLESANFRTVCGGLAQ